MTDPVMITIVMAVQGIVVTGINAYIAIRNHMETKETLTEVSRQVDDTHREINGRMTELLVAAKAQGAQDQRNQAREDAKK
jgi:predicted Holliday junction resolvase-like endonuclease